MDYPPASYYFDQHEYDDGPFDLAQDDYAAYYTSSGSRKRKAPTAPRACDLCRRRKSKCDGSQTGDNVCTNCRQGNVSCTYVETSKPRGPPKAYVTALEDRMEKMEALLTRLRPDTDLTAELGPTVLRGSWRNDLDAKASPPSKPVALAAAPAPAKTPAKVSLAPRMRVADEDASLSDGSDESDDMQCRLASGVRALSLSSIDATPSAPLGPGFIGKSSTIKLVSATRKLKESLADGLATPTSAGADDADNLSTCSSASAYRGEYWVTPEWELAWLDQATDSDALLADVSEALPPDDLAQNLTELFFARVNTHWPLLHRPTFERQRAAGLHERDVWFAALCASVFAVAARWSDDPRVLADSGEDGHAAGWGWFQLVVELHQARRAFLQPAGLFEVQTLCLLPMFLSGTEYEAAAWLYLSMGLRKAQDVGAHRRKVYGRGPANTEAELWRRAFWVLVVQDRMMSAHLGRDCSSREEDFDVQMPLEVDDEYWETASPGAAFTQPTGSPSKVAAFTARIKLSQIVAFALRTVCASEKSKAVLGYAGANWKVEAVTELNAALTEWAKSLPEHLRWSSSMDSPIFAHQSASLFATYYTLQVLIYRPFVAPPCTWSGSCANPAKHAHPHENFPFPAGAICRAAARAFANIGGDLIALGIEDGPTLVCAAQLSAAVLIAYSWEVKVRARAGDAPEGAERVKVQGVLDEARRVMEVLEAAKQRWPNARAVLDDLHSSMPGPEDKLRVNVPAQQTIIPAQNVSVKVEPSWPQMDTQMLSEPTPTISSDWLQKQVAPPAAGGQPAYDSYAGMAAGVPGDGRQPVGWAMQGTAHLGQTQPPRRRRREPVFTQTPQLAHPQQPVAQMHPYLSSAQGHLLPGEAGGQHTARVAKRSRHAEPEPAQAFMGQRASAPQSGYYDFNFGTVPGPSDHTWENFQFDDFSALASSDYPVGIPPTSGAQLAQMSGAGANMGMSGFGAEHMDFGMSGQYPYGL